MFVLEEIKFTKFFDVKSPIGITQKGENLDNYSIGIDLYVPEITPQFIEAFKIANQKNYEHFRIEQEVFHINEVDSIDIINIYDGTRKLGMIEDDRRSQPTLEFIAPITIPTGIGMLIPNNVWYKLTSKSSNFCNGYVVEEGKIDMNFTYGAGVQIIPIPNRECVVLTVGQKFAQQVFIEAVPVLKTCEVPLDEWEKIEEVQFKRGTRTGGMGSEGKF